MQIANTTLLKDWLRNGGYNTLADRDTFEIDKEQLEYSLNEVRKQHPHHDMFAAQDRAVFRILTHNNTGQAKREIDEPEPQRTEPVVQPTEPNYNLMIATQGAIMSHVDGVMFSLEREHKRTAFRWRFAIAALVAIILLLTAIFAKAEPVPEPQPQMLTNIKAIILSRPFAQGGPTSGAGFARMQFLSGNNWVSVSSATPAPITCISGCTAAASFTDNSAFTVGTTAVAPIGAYYTSGADPTLTTGRVARMRMDASSYLYVDCVVGCSGGATTPTDAFATPTTAGVAASFLMGYNGATWDLLRTGDKNNVAAVTGVLNVLSMGRYNATQPTLTDGRYNSLQVGARGSLAVVNGAEGFSIVNVSGTVSLPTGASTAVKQPALGTAGTASTDVITIQGIASMTKLLVTPDSVALPANQSVNVAQINGVTPLMGAGNTGTGSPRVTIATDQAALPVTESGTWTVQPGNTANTTAWKVDNSAVTQPVNLTQVAGGTAINSGVTGSQAVGGCVATNVATPCNPMNLGAQAVSSENVAATTAREVQLVADLVGKLIVLPYSNPENFVSGVITSAMTGTTSTSLVAAPASGLRNYITTIVCSNAHATVGTDIIIQDGNGGTTFGLIPAAAVYGGAVVSLPVPLRQPTTATAVYVANVTTGASTKCMAVGYKGS